MPIQQKHPPPVLLFRDFARWVVNCPQSTVYYIKHFYFLFTGICPQHNVLFDTLSVKEHLWFFTSLKGVDGDHDIMEEVDQMIKSLALEDKRDVQSRNLSGGMKRKLSVGNALVGNSKVRELSIGLRNSLLTLYNLPNPFFKKSLFSLV